MAFDPLSGSGIAISIETGVDAAQAIVREDTNGYRISLHRFFAHYLTLHRQVYGWETGTVPP